jgi:hypothetical protein
LNYRCYNPEELSLVDLVVAPTPIVLSGNPAGGYKIEEPASGTFEYEGELFNVIVRVNDTRTKAALKIINNKGKSFAITKVLMKGGNSANLYTLATPVQGVKRLVCPINNGRNIPEISHISFEVEELKTVDIDLSLIVDPGCSGKSVDATLQVKAGGSDWTDLETISLLNGSSDVNFNTLTLEEGSGYRILLESESLTEGWEIGYKYHEGTLVVVNGEEYIIPLSLVAGEDVSLEVIMFYCSQYCA